MADDSRTELEIFRRILEPAGYLVIMAYDGIEAEELALSRKPDLIILDILMPKKNGYQVCRDLKSMQASKAIPVVMVTSKGEEADVFWGKRQGANEYLVKPFTRDLLLQTVARLLHAPAAG
ncbi:MAG: Alkaline phosphatase synthesis transcriptional regulatory protein PhoP [Myxococcota bacterium]|nr:Alkaline phosphatase synthesis transcriptional regulatory protein PhoP [Myxococcota bacterium]